VSRRRIFSVVQRVAFVVIGVILFGTFGFQASRVDGFSMAPTLDDRDRLLINRLIYEFSDPRPGDVVTFYYPPNPARIFVKRVIATEGHVVQIVAGRVLVDGRALNDDYVPLAFRGHDDWGPQIVEQGYEFVLGDHRNDSSDSRDWGLVPKRYIVGKVDVRWWPLHDVTLF
jgi:signal peptidase I